MSAPPPPPPHGEAPKTTGGSGLPAGNYDIFVIPEHSAGAGFLYLPSMRPNINSFVAGFASALAVVALGNSMAPAFRAWWANFQGMGNVGMVMLVIAVGLGAWSLGRTQNDEPGSGRGSRGSSRGGSPSSGPNSPGQGASPGANGAGNQSGHGAGGAHPGYSSAPPPQQPPPPPPPPPPQNGQERPNQPPPTPDPPPRQGQQQHQSERPKSSWQQSQQQNYQRQAPPQPQPSTPKTESAKGAWQKAREETRRKEDERKAQEAEKRRREETAAKLREIREREARERLERDRRDREEKERRERELKEKRDRELRERTERELREKELKDQRERIEKELREKIAKEQRDKEERDKAQQEQRANGIRDQIERAARELAEKERLKKAQEEERQKELDRINRKGSSYAFSAVGERTNPWPNGKPPVAASAAASSSPAGGAQGPRSAPPPTAAAPSSFGGAGAGAGAGSASPRKPAAAPSSAGPSKQARVQDDDETYSYRPYDKPKRPQPARKKSISDLSDTSWAPSHSTAHTSPPPSMRQPYTTNDPDKIVIRAVYGFLNQFAKTPSSQLLSGVGSVTDGLILRITTEGLFIDDDVRGVPQREWDVKAWTLKLVEVWCPAHAVALANSAANDNSVKPSAANVNNAAFMHRAAWRKAFSGASGVRGEPRPLTDDNADAYLADMLRECKALCGLGLCETGVSPSAFGAFGAAFDDSASASASSSRSGTKSNTQSGEFKTKGLHLLRATVRDQEGKRFLFVLDQEEAWKVSMGLQRLRRGTQVRSLGVSGLSNADVRTTLELLGWA